ncbi:hypothetical protein EYF80_003848 [Liparis tanakae]|uniref:Uncharacterized protein n=1 Tax=Liparis tanakae TaxID=230148 RepID=A0A4Z2J7W7_9TELE|nr:hypothetical protein EYF80_003848 [Liparis tanakae]
MNGERHRDGRKRRTGERKGEQRYSPLTLTGGLLTSGLVERLVSTMAAVNLSRSSSSSDRLVEARGGDAGLVQGVNVDVSDLHSFICIDGRTNVRGGLSLCSALVREWFGMMCVCRGRGLGRVS